MIEHNTHLFEAKGQRYIQNCKTKIQQDVTVYINLLPSSVGKDEIVRNIDKIIANNFKSLEH